MKLKVIKAPATGFCYGVKRAIEILENDAREHGPVATLGAIVHNRQVVQRMASLGVTVAPSLDEIGGERAAIGAHGVTPEMEREMKRRFREVIDTTCPFVRRAQNATHRMADAGFQVVIYGDAAHPEVKGILGWAGGKGIATLDEDYASKQESFPLRVGVLSQTTMIPARFSEFAKKIMTAALVKDAEIRIADTICHDIRQRQQAAVELAGQVDLMLVIGSPTSANTNHLTELCSTITRARLVESAEELKPDWFAGITSVGIAGGASTAEETITEVIRRLEEL